LKIYNTELDKVLLIKIEAFKDHRGFYLETYNKKCYMDNNIDIDFIQDDISVSKRNVLRGIHGDNKTWKLVSCLFGEFYLVVLNNDEESSQYGKWTSFILSPEKYEQVLIPPKFGTGHLVLSEKAIFHYKQNTYYDPESQFSIKWNDQNFNIFWPINNPVLSKRDISGKIQS
tara:strand:+ start:732 stop:1247 length:516 start_codon:yes stop_codon:yes gene_type:complete